MEEHTTDYYMVIYPIAIIVDVGFLIVVYYFFKAIKNKDQDKKDPKN